MKLEKFTKVDVNAWAEISSTPLFLILAFIAIAAIVVFVISCFFDNEALGIPSFVIIVISLIVAAFLSLNIITDKRLEIQSSNIEAKYNTDSISDIRSYKGKEFAKYINPESGLPTTIWFTFNEDSGEPLASIPVIEDNEGLSEDARRDIMSKITK